MPIVHPIKEINDLRFSKLATGRLCKPQAVVLMGHMTVVLLSNGRIFCDRMDLHKRFMRPGDFRSESLDDLLRALVIMKVISKPVLEQHLEMARRRRAEYDRHHDNLTVQEIFKKYNVSLDEIPHQISLEQKKPALERKRERSRALRSVDL